MQFLTEYGQFLAQALTLVAVILLAVGGLAMIGRRQKKKTKGHLEVIHLNQQYEEMEQALSVALLSPQQYKQKLKADKKTNKAKAKADKEALKQAKKPADNSDQNDKSQKDKKVYVLDFNGDLRASAVTALRKEVSAILTVANTEDEVLVRLESRGGAVHGYGLAASQLLRIRNKGIPLIISVDKIAASGGYMMACVANKLIAAPFAFIGAIGVFAQLPNLHRFLQKHDIDYENLYAGEYKLTMTTFGENTDKGRNKLQQQLEEIHTLFKQHVKTHRPNLDIEKVATGEHWLGTRALALGLIDELQISDDYLMVVRQQGAQLLLVKYTEKKKLINRLSALKRTYWSEQEKLTDQFEQPLLM